MSETLQAEADATTKPNRQTRPALPTQKLLTFRQVEMEYGLPYTSIRELMLSGEIPVIQLGGRAWVRRDAWERYLDQSTRQTA